ncbi:MAG TPA: glycosyltransferase family 39 protein [Actinospica sp.]|jgi:hypothetical protein|nr:glycosyltransferase family 39 protein [Actinospica sp.]
MASVRSKPKSTMAQRPRAGEDPDGRWNLSLETDAEEGEDLFGSDAISTVLIPRVPADIRSMEAHEPEKQEPESSGRRGLITRLRARHWMFYLLLAVQAAVVARLLTRNGVNLDEATYLYAGHEELAHWMHGAAIPNYATYFSGAPTIYPPLAALADHFGGLLGARLISLACMLLATACLWGVARRLHSEVAAFGACAAFIALGGTQSLGSFATYDAMALSLMAVSAYLAIRAAQAERHWLPLLTMSALALVLADATKYATALWNPFVVLLFFVALGRLGKRRSAILRAAFLIVLCAGLLVGAYFAAGKSYRTGIITTTLNRTAGSGVSRTLIVNDVKSWIGWVLLLCAIGLVAAILRSEWNNALVGLVCLAAGLAAPGNQLRIDVLTSLVKHVDFGAWFACITVGYLIHVLAHAMITAKEARFVGVVMTCLALLLYAPAGVTQSAQFMQSWPNTANLTAAVGPLVHYGSTQYLMEEDSVLQYDLRGKSSWKQWQNTWGLGFYDAKLGKFVSGNEAYTDAVFDHYFSVIILNGQFTPAIDASIVETITLCKDSCGYKMVANLPYEGTPDGGHFTVWQYQGATK